MNPQWQAFKVLRRELRHRLLRQAADNSLSDVLRTLLSLTQDTSKECFCAGGACDANNYRPLTAFDDQIERQERTAFPLRDDQIRLFRIAD